MALWYLLPIVTLIPIVIKYYKKIYIFITGFPKDLRIFIRTVKVLLKSRKHRLNNSSVYHIFDEKVKQHPDKIAFFYENQKWTFKNVQDYSKKVASYFQQREYMEGDHVALLMCNRVEFPCIWVGMLRVGLITDFMNFNMKIEALNHCMKESQSKALICGEEFVEVADELMKFRKSQGEKELEIFIIRDSSEGSVEKDLSKFSTKMIDLSKDMENTDASNFRSNVKVGFTSLAAIIFTSGTTGLPKASRISNRKCILACGLVQFFDLKSDDRIIITLPLYHNQGAVCGIGTTLLEGISTVIMKKFSASKFWDQCIQYDATVGLYIGEIVRYLVNQPEKPADHQHKVTKFYGNGVSIGTWKKFAKRFPNILLCELYGSTEGNILIVNAFGEQIGACGYIPTWLAWLLPGGIIAIDPDTREILRDPETGLARICGYNEVGEAVALTNSIFPSSALDGYTNKEETLKKLGHDIWNHGDSVFRSGDLLYQDERGYYYFVDRLGDTFRWKSENVATGEVAAVLSEIPEFQGVCVYGVTVEGKEGRAGMAAVEVHEADLDYLDLHKVSNLVFQKLPAYSRPLFLRLKTSLELTGTFKLIKTTLQKEGFDVTKIKDKIYFLQDYKTYVPLTKELYGDIINDIVKV